MKENLKDYKFGIVVYKRLSGWGYSKRSIAVCNCGQHEIGDRPHSNDRFQCKNCGNQLFIKAPTDAVGKRFVIPYLEAVRKDNRGFKVVRTNLSVTYDGFEVTPIQENLQRTMEYDIVDKVLKIWRGDELEYDYQESKANSSSVNSRFFTLLDEKVFLDFVSTEVTRELYEIAHGLCRTWRKKDNIVSGLYQFFEKYQWLQILACAGIPEVERFYTSYGYYGSGAQMDTTKTKPHEILGVPKFMMPYIRQDTTINRHTIGEIRKALKSVDGNKFREILDIVKDEGSIKDLANCLENIMQIHIDYEYKNLKQLILYLFRGVRLTQGISKANEATTLLRDYIRMSRALGLEYEKYPKSLKKVHDVAQLNYNVINQSDKQKELFKLSVEKKSYQALEYIDEKQEYAIILPKTPQDIIDEGNELSHCVASYVNDVNNDKCKIVFLRDIEQQDAPLVTIEVRGYNIRQARGQGNRLVSPEQKEFIKKWAEERKLFEAYY